MSDAKTVSRRIFEEVWNHKNIAAIDELVAADYVHHDSQTPKFSDGREGYKQLVAYYLNAFPDSHFIIDREIQEGDTVVTRWTVTGTHKGDLPTLPVPVRLFPSQESPWLDCTTGNFVKVGTTGSHLA